MPSATGVRPVAGAELAEQLAAQCLDGVFAEQQVAADGCIRLSSADAAQDLQFTLGWPGIAVCGAAGGDRACAACGGGSAGVR